MRPLSDRTVTKLASLGLNKNTFCILCFENKFTHDSGISGFLFKTGGGGVASRHSGAEHPFTGDPFTGFAISKFSGTSSICSRVLNVVNANGQVEDKTISRTELCARTVKFVVSASAGVGFNLSKSQEFRSLAEGFAHAQDPNNIFFDERTLAAGTEKLLDSYLDVVKSKLSRILPGQKVFFASDGWGLPPYEYECTVVSFVSQHEDGHLEYVLVPFDMVRLVLDVGKDRIQSDEQLSAVVHKAVQKLGLKNHQVGGHKSDNGANGVSRLVMKGIEPHLAVTAPLGRPFDDYGVEKQVGCINHTLNLSFEDVNGGKRGEKSKKPPPLNDTCRDLNARINEIGKFLRTTKGHGRAKQVADALQKHLFEISSESDTRWTGLPKSQEQVIKNADVLAMVFEIIEKAATKPKKEAKKESSKPPKKKKETVNVSLPAGWASVISPEGKVR
jgi:hypothetical protein